MRRGHFLTTVVLTLWFAFTIPFANAAQKIPTTDTQIKKAIIKESIASYPGNCPCPYNLASNGSRCGKRSAYSRPGGYSPICYDSDVTKVMINEWRQNHTH